MSMRSQDRQVKGTGSCLRRVRGEGWLSSWGHSPAHTQAAAGWHSQGHVTAQSPGDGRVSLGCRACLFPSPACWLMPGEGHRHPRHHPNQPFLSAPLWAPKSPVCLPRRAGHDPTLGCNCVSHPCLAGAVALSHSGFWEPLHPHAHFALVGLHPAGAPSLCLLSCVKPAAGGRRRCSCFISIPTVHLAAKSVPWQGTVWAVGGTAGGNGTIGVSKAISISIALTS